MGSQLDHVAVRLAMTGLRAAYRRCFVASQGSIPDPEVAALSAVEAANWVCALDEVLRESDPHDSYIAERDTDEKGRVIGGLRHVRDRHMHQVIISTVEDGADFFGSFPFQLSVGTIWKSVDELGEPPEHIRKRKHYPVQREAYWAHLQNRPPWTTIRHAVDFITAEVERRGIALPPENAP